MRRAVSWWARLSKRAPSTEHSTRLASEPAGSSGTASESGMPVDWNRRRSAPGGGLQLIAREGLITGRRIERQSASGVRPGFELRPYVTVTVKFG